MEEDVIESVEGDVDIGHKERNAAMLPPPLVYSSNTVYSTSTASTPSTMSNPHLPPYYQQYASYAAAVSAEMERSRQHTPEKVVELSPNGRYARLNTVLGKGAHKIVYKGLDREEGYEIAWNVIQGFCAEYRDLENEIEILKSVRHRNIITFHDAWATANEFIFITELMTSGTLREYIKKLSKPNNKIVKRWARQILKGLVYLHSHEPPIIHRDIKCDNIFINGAHGEVKIGDMGTAEMKLGKKYTVIGTPEFMAPEMYEEEGYGEKADIYAFGMCLLEMITGEYPYSECKNAAQVYKKVTKGMKPACLSKVQNPEIKELIAACLVEEKDRFSAEEILQHSFLAVDPDVLVLAIDPSRKVLTLQVCFKGIDNLSVKFEFNAETDTAEEVVEEMIQEQVLAERYREHIVAEIKRIVRDQRNKSRAAALAAGRHDPECEEGESKILSKLGDSLILDESDLEGDPAEQEEMRLELEATRESITKIQDRVSEAERKMRLSEQRAFMAEKRLVKTLRERGLLQGWENGKRTPSPQRPASSHGKAGDQHTDIFSSGRRSRAQSEEDVSKGHAYQSVFATPTESEQAHHTTSNHHDIHHTPLQQVTTSSTPASSLPVSSTEHQSHGFLHGEISPPGYPGRPSTHTGMQSQSHSDSYGPPHSTLQRKNSMSAPATGTNTPAEFADISQESMSGHSVAGLRAGLMSTVLDQYEDSTAIDDFINDAAKATNRGSEKAAQWLQKLLSQDIQTVGDLRDLHDEDWAGIGLTVFALRAIKNMLSGEKRSGITTTTAPAIGSQSPKMSTQSPSASQTPSEDGN